MKKVLLTALAALFAIVGCKEKELETLPPVIKAEAPAALAAEGGSGVISYIVENPVEDGFLTAKTADDWLELGEITASSVNFSAGEYKESESRTANVMLSYPGAATVVVEVRQNPAEIERNLTLDIEIKSFGARSVVFNCTPSDPGATYVCTSAYKEDFDKKFTSLEALAEADYQYFIEWGEALGYTPEESIEAFLRKGNLENYDIALPTPEKDYVIYAYGMNDDGTVTSPSLYKVEFKTTAPEKDDCTFDFIVRPGISYTRVGVTPSDISTPYLWGVLTRSEYEALGADPAQALVDEIQAKVDADQALGGDTRFGDFIVYHNQRQNFSDLKRGEEYVVYAFGCDVKGYVITDIMTRTFTEERLEKVNSTFTVTFEGVRASSFVASIAPSDNDVRWFGYTLPYSLLEDSPSVEILTDGVIDVLPSLGIDLTKEDCEYVYKGKQSLTSYDLMGGDLEPNSKNFVAVFGVDASGCRVTDISQAIVTTIEAGTPSDLTVGIETVSEGKNGVVAKFTPSKKEVYMYDIQTKSYYDSFDQFVADGKTPEEKKELKDILFMNELIFTYTNNGLLPYKVTTGDASLTVDEGLEPGVTYVAVAFGVDAGEASTPLFMKEFTVGSSSGTSVVKGGLSSRGMMRTATGPAMPGIVLSDFMSGLE